MPALASHLFLAVIAALTALLAIAVHPAAVAPLAPRDGPAIHTAMSWGYQLQNVRARTIPDGIDLLVVDFARDGLSGLKASDVTALKTRSDGRPRIVLAYMSIGEAESYRYYWKAAWAHRAPAWLGAENPRWKGNYRVRFWHRDWQRLFVDPQPGTLSLWEKAVLLLGLRQKPYIDRIIDAGFDGVYLDRVDAYDSPVETRPAAKAEMAAFVAAISRHAKSRREGFLVVPQNGEELLVNAAYRRAIDGAAKEDLLYGTAADGLPNSRADIDSSVALLNRLQAEGKPVLVVEYLADQAQRLLAGSEIAALGYRMTFARRALNEPPEPPVLSPAVPTSQAPAAAPR